MIRRIRPYFIIGLFLCAIASASQSLTDIQGQFIAIDEVEGIHVLNKTSNRYTISNEDGRFTIEVKLNDTLLISSIKYYSRKVIVDAQVIAQKKIIINLAELVNELEEVVVGKVLTGDLLSDIKISDVKPDINFYDVGIPGNTNLPISQNERRVEEADHGKFIYYYGIGFAINVNKILNRVSGRTKMLKEFVALDKRDECMDNAKNNFYKILFPEGKYKSEIVVAFFYFASEDPKFKNVCLIDNDMQMFKFLELKKIQFLYNLNSTDD